MSSGRSSRFKLMLVFVTTRYGQPSPSVPWETLVIIDSSTNPFWVDGRSLLGLLSHTEHHWCVDYNAVMSDVETDIHCYGHTMDF